MHSPENYIRIPLFVRANQELTDDEKILFGEIEALSNNGYKACYASNAYFAKLYHVSERTISRRIQHLLEEGFITKLESNKRYLRVSHAKQKDFEGHSNIVDYPQYSVIPSSVRFNDSLSAGDRLMFGEIAVLSNNEWETCWVNNQYFTKLFAWSRSTIVRRINKLIEKNHIFRPKDKDSMFNDKRTLSLVDPLLLNEDEVDKDQKNNEVGLFVEKFSEPSMETVEVSDDKQSDNQSKCEFPNQIIDLRNFFINRQSAIVEFVKEENTVNINADDVKSDQEDVQICLGGVSNLSRGCVNRVYHNNINNNIENNIDNISSYKLYINNKLHTRKVEYNKIDDGSKQLLLFYKQNWKTPTRFIINQVISWKEKYGMDLMIYAFNCTLEYGVSSHAAFKYLKTMITNWEKANIDTLEAVRAMDSQRSQYVVTKPRYQEIEPAWFKVGKDPKEEIAEDERLSDETIRRLESRISALFG